MSVSTQDLFSLIQAVKQELQIQSQIFPYMIANKKITVRHASLQIQRMRELGIFLKRIYCDDVSEIVQGKLFEINDFKIARNEDEYFEKYY